jgi:hypothetical protein
MLYPGLLALSLFQVPAAGSGAPSGSMVHRNGRIPPTATAVRVTEPPRLDGVLDDPVWATAPSATEFRRDVPSDGKPAAEDTEVRVLYDEHALYVGARLFNRDPDRVSRRLSRRDSFSVFNDVFFVLVDSYHDHSTAFVFGATPAGERRDAIQSSDGGAIDASWDPVWEVKTRVDSLGWVAEMRIPFSQLRFPNAAVQTWGIQFRRDIRAAGEAVDWSWSPRTEPGAASKYGHLLGLSSIPQPRRLEVLPYTVGRTTFTEGADRSNPFDDGSLYEASAGLDLKYGLTSNITLDATFNPDFGQVEADPAVVNLSAFETFFEERRPFFIERADLFRFGEGSAERFFYSRRVGRAPTLSAEGTADYIDTPQAASILGAVKASGRSSSGWSIGVLEAVTAKEEVHRAMAGGEDLPDLAVEPLTSYTVARMRREYAGGSSFVGGMFTAVNRRLDEPQFDILRSSAYAGGMDLLHRFAGNRYLVRGWLAGSLVNGSAGAMTATQQASTRYYQRPDQDYLSVDPDATSLTGYSSGLAFQKTGGEWNWTLGGSAVSPGYELNDAGFQSDADRITGTAALKRSWVRPGKVFRSFSAQLSGAQSLNYGGLNLRRNLAFGAGGTFHNLWGVNLELTRGFPGANDRVTRGGPVRLQPSNWSVGLSGSTDSRNAIALHAYASYVSAESGAWARYAGASLTFRPQGAFDVVVETEWARTREDAFYVTQGADASAEVTFGRRYLFATLDQHALDTRIRLNWLLSPNLSIQLYAQPFLATGDYEQFKALAEPGSYDFLRYGENGSSITFDEPSQTYTTVGAPGGDPIGFTNPDFRVRSLRGNLVLRWEYRPGSTLFLVWSQNRASSILDPAWNGLDDLWDLRHDPQQNVFLIKLNYYLNL